MKTYRAWRFDERGTFVAEETLMIYEKSTSGAGICTPLLNHVVALPPAQFQGVMGRFADMQRAVHVAGGTLAEREAEVDKRLPVRLSHRGVYNGHRVTVWMFSYVTEPSDGYEDAGLVTCYLDSRGFSLELRTGAPLLDLIATAHHARELLHRLYELWMRSGN